MEGSAGKAKCLVLLALLVAPSLRLEAGGGFSSCRKKAPKALPAAVVLYLLGTAKAMPAKPVEAPVPAKGGPTGALAAAKSGKAEAPAPVPYKSKPEAAEETRLPEALRQLAEHKVDDLVKRAQEVYRPVEGAGAPPEDHGQHWRGREIARTVLKDYRSASRPSDWQPIIQEVDDLAKPGGAEACLDSTRQLVAEFEGVIRSALEDHRTSTASDRDLKLFNALERTGRIKSEEIDLASVYLSNICEILFFDAQKAKTQDQAVLVERWGKAIYRCALLLDSAQERHQHYITILRPRVVPSGHPALLDSYEHFHRNRMSIPSLMEHILQNELEDEYGDEVRAHGPF